MEQATELEWLQWFYGECDFGPAHEDVIYLLQKQFEKQTGKSVPKEYQWDYEG